jgi:hypothetical protein
MTRILFLSLSISLLPALLQAHPAGNLVTAGDYLLWPYVYPVDDAQHHSSVLIWDRQSPVRPLITSEFAGSNYLLYARKDTVYYIESRDSQTENKSYFRVLKGKAGEKPVEIWPWRTDEWRVGNNGFYAVDDEEIIFSRYPNVYSIKRNALPILLFSPQEPVNRLRKLPNGNILLLSDRACRLLDPEFRPLQRWTGFIDEDMPDAPLNINKAYDMDMHNGKLALAYWGGRSFLTIDEHGRREEILELEAPYTAHWVATDGESMYLFASVIQPPLAIEPRLIRFKDGTVEEIWTGE